MVIRERLARLAAAAKQIGALDLAVRNNPILRHQVRATLKPVRQGTVPQRRAALDALTSRILAQARRTRYGRAFGDDLKDWPVLRKAQLRDDPAAFMRPGLIRLPAATAGTTGVPLLLSRSLRSIAAEQEFLDELLAPSGLSWARARVAVLRGDTITPRDDEACRFGQTSHGGRRLTLSSPHLTAESLDWYVARLREFQPALLYIYPTVLANLLRLLIRSDRWLPIPLVVVTSERMPPELYGASEQILGAKVIDYYGMAERSVLAVRRESQQWFFDPAYGVVELIPSAEERISADQRQVPIIATGFWTDAQPLIRYDTGDRAIVPAGARAGDLAAIGAGEAPFLGIAGRSDDFVFAPDGLRIAGLNQIPRDVRHLLQLQIVQDAADQVTLRVLATPDFCHEDQARLLANARNKIPTSMKVTVATVGQLETLPSGKAPFIIRRVAVTESAAALV